MELNKFIESLLQFMEEGKTKIVFGTDEELNNVFDKPFWQSIEGKPELLVFSPSEGFRVEIWD